MRYLGAAIQTTRRGCKEAKLGLFTKDETNSTTRWQIIDLPDLRPWWVGRVASALVLQHVGG